MLEKDAAELANNARPERRLDRRNKVFWGASVQLNSFFEPFACVLCDISNSGARLAMAHKVMLPARFNVALESKNLLMLVETVWTKNELLGVRFISSEPLKPGGQQRTPATPAIAV